MNARKIYFTVFSLVSVIAAFILLMLRMRIIFDHNTNIAGIEEVFVHYCLRLYHHHSIYTDPEHIPYLNCQYTPLYFETVANTLRLFHPAMPDLIRDIYITGRSIDLVSNLLTSFLVGLCIYQNRKVTIMTAIAVGCLSFLFFSTHHFVVRPDSFKTLFVIAGFYFFISAIRSGSIRAFICSMLFATIAVLVKQDAMIFVIALMSCYLIAGRKWWLYIGIYIVSLFSFLFLLSVYYGPFFWKNVLLGLHFRYSLAFAGTIYATAIFRILFVAAGTIFCALFILRRKGDISRPIALLPLVMLPAVILASMKWGSSAAYFTDLIMIYTILIPVLVPDHAAGLKIAMPAMLVFFLLFLLFEFILVDLHYTKRITGTGYLSFQKDMADYDADCAGVARYISADPDSHALVFTFDKNLSNHLYDRSLFDSYETEFPQYLFTTYPYGNNEQTWQSNVPNLPDQILNYDDFNLQVKSGKIKYLVLTKDMAKPDFLHVNFDRFKLVRRTDHFDIYKYE